MKKGLYIFLLCAAGVAAQSRNPVQDLIEGGHYKRARAVAEARYREAPNDPEALWGMSRVRQIWDNLDEAQKLIEKAVALAPKEAHYHYQLAEVAGQKAEKASVIHQIGLGRQFKKEVDLTLQLDPRHVGAMRDLMVFYLEAPGVIGGDKAKARAMVEQIAKVDPVEGYQAEIQLARHEKRDPHAEDLFRKAVEARPQSYSARIALASQLANAKKLAEAETHSREAVKLQPDRAFAYSLLAAVLVQQDLWSELDQVLEQAEKAVPDNLFAYYRAGNNCLARKVDLSRAERYFRKYLGVEPEPGSPPVAAAHWRLGLVLEAMGRKADAIKELETSVKLDASNAQAKADLKRLRG